MDSSVAALLASDGIVNGAIYALMALAIVLLFSVTRVLFIAQGEFVVFGAATMFQLQNGQLPSAVWLLVAGAALCLAQEVASAVRRGLVVRLLLRRLLSVCIVPLLVVLLALALKGQRLHPGAQAILTLVIITPLGGLVHRIVYQSLSRSSVLTLLIVSVGVHFALTSLALAFFGPEGFRTDGLSDTAINWGLLSISGQGLVILVTSAVMIVFLSIAFNNTFRGLALRATSVNQIGARIVGLSVESAGRLSFALAAAMGALAGVLISPTVTIFYDSGFLIGLKGFVAAVFAGLASFPGALVGSIVVGLIEAFASFFASAFKDSIVFTLIIPILLWRSLNHPTAEEH